MQKARSLPKLQVEDAAELNKTEPVHVRRYLTPQPEKRKPFIPPRPPSTRRSCYSPTENGIPEHPEEHNGLGEDTDIRHSKLKGTGIKTHKTHENERLEEAKRDLVASSGPLTPKRKAPQAPPNNAGRKGRRRKSETNAVDIRQLQKNQERYKSQTLSPGMISCIPKRSVRLMYNFE